MTVYSTQHVKNIPAVQGRGSVKPSNKNRFLAQNKNSLGSNQTRSMPSSPSLAGAASPSLAPTSVPLSQQQAERTKAIRRPIIHKLALGPASTDEIQKSKRNDTTDQEFQLALEKVADCEDGKWKLNNKLYKELDIWSYKRYTSEERQIAIDNAIRVYDKLRLNASEPEWDRLLPQEERGTGKCLSKLQAKIASGTILPKKAPKITVNGAEDSGRETAVEDDDEDDLFGDKSVIKVKAPEMTRSHSNPPTTKTKKVSEKEAQAKRLLAKPGKVISGKVTKPLASKPEKKTQQKDTKFKSSQFVSDSDEEEDTYLMDIKPKARPAPAASNNGTTTTVKPSVERKPLPKPTTKRPRNEKDEKPAAPPKPKGHNVSPKKSSPLASSPPTNASDIEDSSPASVLRNLKRKASDETTEHPAKRHQKSSSVSTTSTSSSITSANGVGSSGRMMERDWSARQQHHAMVDRFNAFYPKYFELYHTLEKMEVKDPDKMADLVEMHKRLEKLKRDCYAIEET